MDTRANSESGYICDTDLIGEFSGTMTDVEIVAVTGINVLARGRRYGRQWMLKGLREDLRDSTAHRQRLMKEFEIHSGLLHPGIVQAVGLEYVEPIGYCIIMEWIEGQTLAEAIAAGLPADERRRLMMEIIMAVAYLHERGVVHRDLKPTNIMVRRNGGQAVIIDFGLADTDAYVLLKQPAGTQGYMSDEQKSKARAETSNDVFSLGVIMMTLCPSWTSTARRCMASASRRYWNARQLLDAISSRARFKRRLGRMLIVAVFVIGAVAVAIVGAENAGEMSVLRETARNNELVAGLLRDSLAELNLQLSTERNLRMAETERRKQIDEAINDGKHRIDSVFNFYLAKYPQGIDLLSEESRDIFYNAVKSLNSLATNAAENYEGKLSHEDLLIVNSAINQYYIANYEKWVKKFAPTVMAKP